MQAISKLVLATILASSAFMASAEDAHHPADVPSNSAENTAPAPAPESAAMTQAMTDQMQKMQAAHDKAAAAKTPAERHAAMQEGMKTMKDSMAMMSKHHSAMGCMNMSGDKNSGGMGMMDMMMKMMDQQSNMMNMPMTK
ncbi:MULTISPECIES: hypothetical protein [unclassified Pseudomonas]|uniref:hypothetical protein n=1 Tax=unclassified Pseudomonas TaxID=196821 RepID=UPI000726C148|nr:MULTISPECIES: hypothetical protein [unclassified Pseudomonas]KQN42155.1 hypothetical protein ASE98_13190 [Pseudomonas sp. Leaf48]MDR6925104.1 hypothetical protein [Pseudomonas sp. BE134]